MTHRVNLTAWRSRLKRQICRRMAVRFLLAGSMLLSALLPVYLLHSLNVQHLAVLQDTFDEREIRLGPQRAEFARQRAVQRQAEAEICGSSKPHRKTAVSGICWFFCRRNCRKMPGWRVSGRAAKV
ncbi:hypothetical protein UA45_18610 [Morganella morganii]|uniref:Uncharacterized protein n=1 Tax=Morganella morganii TaxID=582 RepID=A0A0D8L5H5_MORMO|nr:hypothetical protein UA45_18610 [Morganella morganii]